MLVSAPPSLMEISEYVTVKESVNGVYRNENNGQKILNKGQTKINMKKVGKKGIVLNFKEWLIMDKINQNKRRILL